MASENNPIGEEKKNRFSLDFSAISKWIERVRGIFSRGKGEGGPDDAVTRVEYASSYDSTRQEIIIKSVVLAERLEKTVKEYSAESKKWFKSQKRIEVLREDIGDIISECEYKQLELLENRSTSRDALNIVLGEVIGHLGVLSGAALNVLNGIKVQECSKDIADASKEMQQYKDMPRALLGSLLSLISSCVENLLYGHDIAGEGKERVPIEAEGQIEGLNILAGHLEELREKGHALTSDPKLKELLSQAPSYEAPSSDLLRKENKHLIQGRSESERLTDLRDVAKLNEISEQMRGVIKHLPEQSATVSPMHNAAASQGKEGNRSR